MSEHRHSDITEKGLESLIMQHMTGQTGLPGQAASNLVKSAPIPYSVSPLGSGWVAGDPRMYDRGYALDVPHLLGFLQDTQAQAFHKMGFADFHGAGEIKLQKFLTRVSNEIGKRGVIDVLRKGIDHESAHFELFYGTPSEGNAKAQELHNLNRFVVTRQLRYSMDETRRALDLCLFINGLPIATFELKNSLTKQTVHDAVEQYKTDRPSAEKLFAFGRCVVHFAVDDSEVRMCTELKDKKSWFLPFNKGWNDGAGNPPNPNGLRTDYLWKEVLAPVSLTNILENFAQIVEEKDAKTGKKKFKQVFPRYHQLLVVRKLLADAHQNGVGKRYLIQHSAGSGKSNSIAWLAHQLIGLRIEGKPLFESVIVVTDRRILDDQIQRNIKQFMQVGSTVGCVQEGTSSSKREQLRKFIEAGKKIIVTTIQSFPNVVDVIGDEHRGNKFGIIIDEAHSSQGGKTSAAMSEALAADDPEDAVNDVLEARIKNRKMLNNASYFAFTATPKNKTLEMFGEPQPPDSEGKVQHKSFHSYTMKQAIQEGFIMDVLKNFTPVNSYYKLVKKIEGDPEFDTRKAKKKLRKYVESHDHAIRLKAEIMVDHFHDQVLAVGKMGGKARAMVVCSGIERAIQYFHAFQAYLQERKSPYRAIVAFSGEHDYGAGPVSESSLNQFPSSNIADKIQNDPYRFLICADKFQTGYDEPLLHTMYVDKGLSGIKAVQTLSRLNRAHPEKRDVFILDFQNNTATITEAFADYYRTTVLSEETDPNKLHDLKASLDNAQVYSPDQVDLLVERFIAGVSREKIDPILDACVGVYLQNLDEDQQVEFKGKSKAFVRTYDFLGSILSYGNREWEKLSIFLGMLVDKLPSPQEQDLSKGILETIDMDSYRVEKKNALNIDLPDENSTIGPVPVEAGGHKPSPELDKLSNILKTFNEQFGALFNDSDRVFQRIQDDVAPRVASDSAFQNARTNTPGTAHIEFDKALARVMLTFLKDDTQVYKLFVEDPHFKRFLSDAVYRIACA